MTRGALFYGGAICNSFHKKIHQNKVHSETSIRSILEPKDLVLILMERSHCNLLGENKQGFILCVSKYAKKKENCR